MSEENRALLENEAAEKVWEMLVNRYPDRRLTPDTSPQLDLVVDSMEWVNLTMEIGESTGVKLDEEAIERIETIRDLLQGVAESGETASGVSPVKQPDEALDENQKRWLRPLRPAASVAARAMFLLNRTLVRGLLRLRVEGLENLP